MGGGRGTKDMRGLQLLVTNMVEVTLIIHEGFYGMTHLLFFFSYIPHSSLSILHGEMTNQATEGKRGRIKSAS